MNRSPLTPFIVPVVVMIAFITLASGVTALLHSSSDSFQTALTVAEVLGNTDTAGYKRATEPHPFVFPEDHGAHDGFKTEWWYFTGNLTSSTGRHFGYQLTFFRSALRPPSDNRANIEDSSYFTAWSANHLWMAHFALTDVQNSQFYAFERFSREAQGLAGILLSSPAVSSVSLTPSSQQPSPFRLWLGRWSAERLLSSYAHHTAAQQSNAAQNGGMFPLRLCADDRTSSGLLVGLRLVLDSIKAPTLQGNRGLSQKGASIGNASMYYSMTHLPTRGTVFIGNDTILVTGTSWMDREWSTSALDKGQVGWDWFSLHLDDAGGTPEHRCELMYYQLRTKSGTADSTSKGSLTRADGSVRSFRRDEIHLDVLQSWRSKRSNTTYPAQWRLRVPNEGIDLLITPYIPNQELTLTVRYWEGAVRVQGTHNGRAVRGNGYVELTGYDKTSAAYAGTQ